MLDQIQDVSFCTFGMFIIDEIEWQTPNPPEIQYNLIGGAGTYAALGARLAVSPSLSLSRSVSWIVDIGSDFPNQLRTTINKWNTNCIFREDQDRLTTRAWNGYGENGWRDFKYLTEKRRLEVSSLSDEQALSKSFHMVCSPARCMELTHSLRQKRATIYRHDHWPVIVWEPIPDLCLPQELSRLHEAARNCCIVSPNHDELKLFFQDAKNTNQAELVSRLMGWDLKEDTEAATSAAVPIIREGSNGSTAYFRIPLTNQPTFDDMKQQVITIHLSAYHDSSMSHMVIDPTGGGNTYLGALAVSMTGVHAQSRHPSLRCIDRFLRRRCQSEGSEPDLTQNSVDTALALNQQIQAVLTAMIFANIAASFAIEQHGVPDLAASPSSQVEIETWNGDTFLGRLEKYMERECQSILDQLNSIEDQ